MDWLQMQLADSAFPIGGFAHSGGLEAALQLGEIKGAEGFKRFLSQALWQQGYSSLILASASHANPNDLLELDQLCDIFLNSHVANRVSRTQGRTFLATCIRVFADEKVATLQNQINQEILHLHFAPIFGATLKILGLEKKSMQHLLLHGSLRGIISAAIRLGVIGPYQGQQIQWQFSDTLNEILVTCDDLKVSDLAQTAPLQEILQSTQDRLYSKLFQS